jgi:hypothetical protein
LAARLGIKDYPNPSGGCLLTDPAFARRVRDHLEHEGKLSLDDALLLMIGRHFRIDGVKIVVGRNKDENDRLMGLAERRKAPYLMVKDYKGPVTLIMGKKDPAIMEKAAAITVRYSDAPKNIPVSVICKFADKESEIKVVAMSDKQIERLRI